jgi:hypothetical protein
MSKNPEISDTVRPSHRAVIDHIEDWANSPGLQPPMDTKTVRVEAEVKPPSAKKPKRH